MASSNLWLGNDIKSVAVMSDMHLGASNCVLDGTPDPLDENGKFSRFLEKEIGKTDAFILLGDVYELALATYDKPYRAPRSSSRPSRGSASRASSWSRAITITMSGRSLAIRWRS